MAMVTTPRAMRRRATALRRGLCALLSKTYQVFADRRNLAVHYWTINDPAEMRRLVLLGADGIMTDRPDLLRAALTGLDRTGQP